MLDLTKGVETRFKVGMMEWWRIYKLSWRSSSYEEMEEEDGLFPGVEFSAVVIMKVGWRKEKMMNAREYEDTEKKMGRVLGFLFLWYHIKI